MFILSIVPLHLSMDSDNVAVNYSNELDVIEHKIMELEAIYTGFILRQYVNYNYNTYYNYNLTTAQQELERLRAQELQLLQSGTGTVSDNDSQARLSLIQTMQSVVNIRLNDLSTLYNNLSTGTRSTYIVSGVDNANIYSVLTEQQRVMLYQQELANAQTFWEQVIALKTAILNPPSPPTEENTDGTEGTDAQTTGDTNDTGSTEESTTTPAVDPTTIRLFGLTPEMSEKLAISKRAVESLKTLFNTVTQKADVSEIVEKIEAIYTQLEAAEKNAQTVQSAQIQNGVNAPLKKVYSLTSELKGLLTEKNVRLIMSLLGDSIQGQLNAALESLNSLF